jgi:hypothetical protein
MCSSKPKVPDPPKIPEPAPTPPPPEESATAPVTQEGVKRTGAQKRQEAKKRGTQALRIDINMAQPGGKGLNIPRG